MEYTSKYYNSKGKHRTRNPPPAPTKTKACQLWENIRNRCEYLPYRDELRFGKYLGADSCEDWKDFQVFAQWFEDVTNEGFYHKGWQLDKDLLVKGNKIYSPEFCVFLPEEINKALNIKTRCRGDYPLGISPHKTKNKLNVQFVSANYPEFNFRAYIDESQIEEGFHMYKAAREKFIRFLANKWKEQLDPRAYDALMSYEVCIDD